jgi:hypothetical protein
MRTHVFLLLACAQLAASHAAAADLRTWRVAGGVTFELSRSDLRAWTGDTAGPPVFSVAALLADEKRQFDTYAEELARGLAAPDPPTYGDYTFAQSVAFEVLSVVGPLVSYRETGGGDTPGAAHPSRYDVLQIRDVRRKEDAPTLLDYYSEAQIRRALQSDPWVRKFSNPENPLERAASLQELFDAVDRSRAQEQAEEGDCAFDVSLGSEMLGHFFFHHVEKDRVAVRIAVAPMSEWCNRIGGVQYIGLLLPIPEALRADLLGAQRGEGLLAGSRKDVEAFSYSANWEVDIRTLVAK